jgi:hypothetical protein
VSSNGQKFFAAIVLVGVGFAVGKNAADEAVTKTIVVRETLPPKTITKTETKTRTVTKHVPIFPATCLAVMDQYTSFHENMTDYEKTIGKFEVIQSEAVKAIALKDIQELNAQKSALSKLKSETDPSIQAMMENKKVIDQNISQCKRTLGN